MGVDIDKYKGEHPIMHAKTTLELTQQLIARPSITPEDGGCQELLAAHLAELGFKIEALPFGEVKNIWARRGTQEPLLVFAGHTDVVPTGPLTKWTFPPFTPTIQDGYLYGRGAVDMKSGLAAMVMACKQFIATYPDHKGSIAFLLTSDEEGPSIDGTTKVVDFLTARGEKMDWCIVGEPSSDKQLGDIIKVGRRGSLNGKLTIYGQQGHIAYAENTNNPIHQVTTVLSELYATSWDQGTEYFSPTRFQASNIHSGTGASNVVPGELELIFNFRYSPVLTAEALKISVEEILQKYGLHYHLEWSVPAKPFYTKTGHFAKSCQTAVHKITGITSELSTLGGTSDGRFISPTGCEVVELGLCNATIHEINERAPIADLEKLTEIYKELLVNLFSSL